MKDKKPVSEEDMSLFRDAVGDVKPVNNDKHPPSRPRPAPRVQSEKRDNDSVMNNLMSDHSELDLIDTGEHLSYTAPGIQHSELRKLKSGKYAIKAELDLHGLKRTDAQQELHEFISMAQQRDTRCVRIIHGRGRKVADQSPVLKKLIDSWLRHNKQVLAFCSARENDGGTGAVYVLLRKS